MLAIQIPPGRADLLALAGELDAHTAPRLQHALRTKLKEHHRRFYLDCSALRFLDSRGIAALIEYMRDAKAFGGELVLANATGVVAEVLKIARLEEHFHCTPSERAKGGRDAGFVEAAAGI